MGNYAEATKLRQEAQRLPSGDLFDPDDRLLRYVRYADDFVLGFSGPKAKAQVGSNHGRTTALDPRGLPVVPHGHPPRAL